MKTFQGSRYALFAYNTESKEGGFADFEDFKVTEPLADRSKNIPLGKNIALTNLATNTRVWANPCGMMHFANSGSKEFDSEGGRYKVHDPTDGKVVLEAMNGTGFLTVVGVKLSGDVRRLKEESAGGKICCERMCASVAQNKPGDRLGSWNWRTLCC